MKNILLAILYSALILISSSCGGTHLDTEMVNKPVLTEKVNLEEAPGNSREEQKKFVDDLKSKTVSIKFDCDLKEGVSIFAPPGVNPNSAYDSRGTGVVLRTKNSGTFIATAAHVVEIENAQHKKLFECSVYVHRPEDASWSNAKGMKATIVASDTQKDLAIIKIEEKLGPNSLISEKNFTGERIWSSGFGAIRATRQPMLSITTGTLATLNINRSGVKVHRINCQVFQGNSGGGIWDSNGNLVGIVSFLYGANVGGDLMPFEGEYYIIPSYYLVNMSVEQGVFSEVFLEK